ncbi:RNA polymerase factor sigma-54 [Pseudorhodobacter wandonensis]|uniref:RNA polymerase factor sigma-54 n=1 Tax=Pseudorhodobacter wandonensis TaxID=1120568 RepID=UPI00067B163E|nr:RNA polymerase factor sigma-54 [Pseudorhodobacter wandonensis]
MTRPSARLELNQKLSLNAALTTSIRVLRMDASGLTRYLEEQAAENPHLALRPAKLEPEVWLPRWTAAFAAQGMGHAGSPDIGALLQAPAISLIAHVSNEIERVVQPADWGLATALMQALEPTGWLGRPLAAIAAEAGVPEAEAERVLLLLQGIEPTGIFARSLAECLQLQAIEAGCHDSTLACMLEHLDLLAEGEIARLAKMCSVDEAAIMTRLRLIRSFDPKPGTRFGQDAAPVREPDLAVSRGVEGWVVRLNRSSLPDVQIVPPAGDGHDAVALAHAREVQRMVHSRNQTLLRVAQDILKRQEKVLSQGLEQLQPMSMQEVAASVGLNISTVSRAIAGVSVDAPRGTIWLRALFTEAVGGAESGVAAGALRAKLLRLVREEDRDHPLGDLALAEALSMGGVTVARRTVAKYRSLLDIPPAHRRKRKLGLRQN